MFAQVIEATVGPAGRPELARLVRETVVPAFRHEDGFSGAVGMVESGTGRAMMVAFWECEEQARIPPELRGDAVRIALAGLELLSAGRRSISTWEVRIEL